MTEAIRVAHVATIDLTLRNLLMPQLVRLRAEGFEVFGISAPGPWTADLERAGIRHVPWPHATRAWDPAADVRAMLALIKVLREGRFDVVHTHNPKPAIMGRFAARLVRVPCVINTVHGFYTAPGDRAAKRMPILALEWAAARFSDLELYQSEEDLAWVRRIKLVKPDKTVLLGNGTDLSKFDPSAISAERLSALRSELGISQRSPIVGTVGRLVVEKGYRELFAAARLVERVVPECRFVIVGDADPDKDDALKAEDTEGAPRNVVFAGWRENIPELVALMDVFVLPSWREGLPRSAIEAAAMGKPMVLTDIRGCREVVRDGVEGLLVPVRDTGALASAILKLLTSDTLRERFGSAARVRALERFNEDDAVERVVSSTWRVLHQKGLSRHHSLEDLERSR